MVSKKIVVDLFYDVISPYSWLGFELATRHANIWPSVSLQLKPLLLGFLMKESGNSPPMMVANKAKYMVHDLKNYSKYLGVPLSIPANFPTIAFKPGSRNAMRFVSAVHLITKGKSTEAISREFWKRLFGRHEDIHEIDSLTAAGKAAGLSDSVIQQALAQMDTDEVKDVLKKNTDEALAHGAFGAPTFVAHLSSGPVMLFGSDRVEVLASVLGEPYKGPLVEFSKL